MVRVWLVPAGEHGEDERTALREGLAIIGFRELGDLAKLKTRAALWRACRHALPALSRDELSRRTDELYAFRRRMAAGDLAVLPCVSGPPQLAVGRVSGDYRYLSLAGGQRHVRAVRWLRTDIPPEALELDLRGTLWCSREVRQAMFSRAAERFEGLAATGTDPGVQPPDAMVTIQATDAWEARCFEIIAQWYEVRAQWNAMAHHRDEFSREHIEETGVACATALVFHTFRTELTAHGLDTVERFYEDFVRPMAPRFRELWEQVTLTMGDGDGFGPKHVTELGEEMALAHLGEVPEAELQEFRDRTVVGDGALIELSAALRRRMDRAAERLKDEGLAPRTTAETADWLHAEAVQAALTDTGPAHRKQRGPTAGQPKRLSDAFGDSQRRELVRQAFTAHFTATKEPLDPETADALMALAREHCTEAEQRCISLIRVEARSLGATATALGLPKSTVQSQYDRGMKKLQDAKLK